MPSSGGGRLAGRTDSQHRARGETNHPIRHAPQQHAPQAAAPVSTDDDQIGALVEASTTISS
jgi:hypothetical protein